MTDQHALLKLLSSSTAGIGEESGDVRVEDEEGGGGLSRVWVQITLLNPLRLYLLPSSRLQTQRLARRCDVDEVGTAMYRYVVEEDW